MKTLQRSSFSSLLFAGALSVALVSLAASRAAGATYEVGPGQVYLTIGGVPWESLAAGDTVRIHWRAQPYQEKWVICRQGTALAPITVQGVAGPEGQLPVISGSGATTRPALNYWGHDRGVIKIGGANTPPDTTPKFIVIENLDIQNARPPYTYTYGITRDYNMAAAAIYVEKGENITIRNCTIHDCGNGLFVASNDALASRNILVEGCYIFGNGNEGSGYEHNTYTAAIGATFQYNRFGPLRTGCPGNNIKDRSAGLVVCYNWIEGGGRQLDMVDGEDSVLIRNDAGYGQDHVYGNILIEPAGDGNNQMMQYGGDSGATDEYRQGLLLCYNNTFITDRTDNTVLAKLSTNDETCDFRNNIVFASAAIGKRVALLGAAGVMNISHNWIESGYRTSFEVFTGTLHNDGTTISGTAPGFVDAPAQDFQLGSASPCVNAAGSLHASAFPPEYEYVKHQTGQERPVAGLLDIGALERPSLISGTSGALITGRSGTPVAGEPLGTYYKAFGVPSINDAVGLAFTAQITLDQTTTYAVLTGTSPSVLVRQGGIADGTGGAKFKSFREPLLNQYGMVTFLAKVSGSSVTSANDEGIWSTGFQPGLVLVAREGDPAEGAGGATFLRFKSVALETGSVPSDPLVAWCATLSGTGVGATNNEGVWSHDGTTRLLLRKGMTLTVDGGPKTLTSFTVLKAQSGAPGQGFGLSAARLTALLSFGDKTKAVATVPADGTGPDVVVLKGDDAPEYGAGVLFSTIKAPCQNSIAGAAFITSVNGAVTSASNAAIYAATGGWGGDLDRIAAKGDPAPGVEGGATFKMFKAAVNNSSAHVAFMAMASGTGVTSANDLGVWVWDGADIVHVAQEADAAPETGGATWMGVASLALPDGGRPLFVGTLIVGTGVPAVTKGTDSGLWCLDASGDVRLLVREGVTTVDGRTVKSFKVLGNVSGSPSQVRGHNGTGRVVYLASFTDGTQGIVPLELP